MVYPNPQFNSYPFFQGILISDLVCTVTIYFVLKMFHYGSWGYLEEKIQKLTGDGEPIEEHDKEELKNHSQFKWDQKQWNMYFPIIFANHVASLCVIIIYSPNIYACVAAYLHFTCFCGMIINSIFIDDKPAGEGSRTKANRVFWLLMCLFNLALMVGGVLGIDSIIQ